MEGDDDRGGGQVQSPVLLLPTGGAARIWYRAIAGQLIARFLNNETNIH